jgi:hypothetical protein
MSRPDQTGDEPLLVLTNEGELYGADTPENRQLSRRLKACFLACEGISTEELEQGIVADMRRVISEVEPVLRARIADAA